MPDIGDTTDDWFLGGKLLLRQPKRGHRAGHDAMLLATFAPAKPGQKVIDLGAGVGAAGLAVARRVPGVELTLLEIDPASAALAAHNATANALNARVLTADVADRAALPVDTFDLVLMNPPFHDAARHRPSPQVLRQVAHVASDDTLAIWTRAAHRSLKSGGMLTMIWRADGLGDVLQNLGGQFGGVEILPVHATQGKPAVRILVKATKGGKGPLTVHEGVKLDDDLAKRALRGAALTTG